MVARRLHPQWPPKNPSDTEPKRSLMKKKTVPPKKINGSIHKNAPLRTTNQAREIRSERHMATFACVILGLTCLAMVSLFYLCPRASALCRFPSQCSSQDRSREWCGARRNMVQTSLPRNQEEEQRIFSASAVFSERNDAALVTAATPLLAPFDDESG